MQLLRGVACVGGLISSVCVVGGGGCLDYNIFYARIRMLPLMQGRYAGGDAGVGRCEERGGVELYVTTHTHTHTRDRVVCNTFWCVTWGLPSCKWSAGGGLFRRRSAEDLHAMRLSARGETTF